MPFIKSVFISRLQENLDEDSAVFKVWAEKDPNISPTIFATAWSEAIYNAAQAIIPPSLTHSPAKQAMYSSLLSTHHQSDSAGNTLKDSISQYASIMAGGMAPTFTGIPPSGPPAIEGTFPTGLDGASFKTWASEAAGVLSSWFSTGIAINNYSGTPIPWI